MYLRKTYKNLLIFTLAFVLMGSLLIVKPATAKAATTTTANYSVVYKQSDARKLFTKVNDFRTGKNAWYWNADGTKNKCSNLKKLKYDYSLEKIAMKRASEIATLFSHTRPDNTMCFTAYNIEYMAVGENIAAGQTTSLSVFNSWKEDDFDYNGQGHRRNMLSNSFNCMGCACVEKNGVKYWVQEFAYRNNINTKKTTANNQKSTVSVKYSSDLLYSVSLKTKSISIKKGKNYSAKNISYKIMSTNRFPDCYTTMKAKTAKFTSSSSKIISIGKNGTYITGKKKGTATVKIKAFGTTKSVKVIVK